MSISLHVNLCSYMYTSQLKYVFPKEENVLSARKLANTLAQAKRTDS